MLSTHSLNMIPVTALLLTGIIFIGVSGCGPSEKKPELKLVTGVVTLNGKPLEAASISFVPKSSGIDGSGKESSATTKADGTFVLYYDATTQGASLGQHTVQVSKLSGTFDVPGEELIRERYNIRSILTAEVTAAGANEFTFDLKQTK